MALSHDGWTLSYRQLVDLEMWCHLLRAGSLRYTPARVCRFRRHAAQESSANRGSGLHERELARLLETYGDTAEHLTDRQLLAGWSYRLRRHDTERETLRRLGARIDERLGAGAGLARLRFRLGRPLANLERRAR